MLVAGSLRDSADVILDTQAMRSPLTLSRRIITVEFGVWLDYYKGRASMNNPLRGIG